MPRETIQAGDETANRAVGTGEEGWRVNMTSQTSKRADTTRAAAGQAQPKAARATARWAVLCGLAALTVVLAVGTYGGWQTQGDRAPLPAVLVPPPVIASSALPSTSPTLAGAPASPPAVQARTAGRTDPTRASTAWGGSAQAAHRALPRVAMAPSRPVSALAVSSPHTSGSTSPGAGLAVTGIVGGASRVAIIEGRGQTYVVRVGDRIGAASVVGIAADRVVLKQGGSVFALALTSVSRVNSLATNAGTAAGAASTPGSSGAGATQAPPAGTGQPFEPVQGITPGAPAAPSTAQPVSAPGTPGGSTPAPGFATPVIGTTPLPGIIFIAAPGPGQVTPAYQVPSQAPVYLLVVPSNTPQPPIPPVMPPGATVFTPQPNGGGSVGRLVILYPPP